MTKTKRDFFLNCKGTFGKDNQCSERPGIGRAEFGKNKDRGRCQGRPLSGATAA